MTVHEIPFERRSLHGTFCRDYEPCVSIEPGDSVVFRSADAGWGIAPPADESGTREQFGPRDPERDGGHALVGPIEVRGARAGGTLVVDIDELRVGTWGITDAGGWSTPLNDRLGVGDGEVRRLVWELDAGWGIAPPADESGTREQFGPRDPERDGGHALVGPIEVRGARAGGTLVVDIDQLRVGTWGITDAGGWSTPLNDRLGVGEGEVRRLVWQLDADAGIGRDQHGREVELRPFLGVIGMPPPEPGIHRTSPPRKWGGNIDCTELVAGTTLYLPISVDGALLSAGDGHARQGDGEVSQLAIEAPMERAQLTVSLSDLQLDNPIARIGTAEEGGAWVTFGFDEDLDEAAAQAVDGMLQLLGREHGLERRDALALASIVVDVRVTQLVNGVRGAHAILRDDAFR